MSSPRILIATPAAGNKVGVDYLSSALRTQDVLGRGGLGVDFAHLGGAWTAEARNFLASHFLGMPPSWTHLLFVDADMGWNPEDILRLLAQDVPIIGALYPRKALNFAGGLAAAKEVPDLDLTTFRHILTRRTWAVHPVGDDFPTGTETRRPVDWLPTGFLLLRRDALETLRPLCTRYTNVAGGTCFDFFRYDLRKDEGKPDPERCGEDRSFGDLARSAGLTVWQLLNVELSHTGEVTF